MTRSAASQAAERLRWQSRLVGGLFWSRRCAVCDKPFSQRRAGRPRLYCSADCMRREKNRRAHLPTGATC